MMLSFAPTIGAHNGNGVDAIARFNGRAGSIRQNASVGESQFTRRTRIIDEPSPGAITSHRVMQSVGDIVKAANGQLVVDREQ